MSEYWVSKKQYWCKYCNIWVRDDAPSKRLHESGLKHQGSKERFIRDLYKGGERAKRDKAAEARQIERIEAAARAAHSSKDGGAYAGRPMAQPTPPPVKKRDKAPADKWSNYSTAAQLGLTSDDTPSSYEIEQMVRGRGTAVGQWQEVVETPTPPPTQGFASPAPSAAPQTEEEEAENFKFQHRDKRPLRDMYDDDDYDPRAALGGIKLKSKERKIGEATDAEVADADVKDTVKEEGTAGAGFSSTGWGKAEPDNLNNEVKAEVKTEPDGPDADDAGPDVKPAEREAKPDIKPDLVKTEQTATEPAPAPSMFKKRRPPPSSRKK